MSTDRAPELHPWLQGTPSLATQTTHTIHKLVQELNTLTELVDRLKTCTGLRAPDQYGTYYEHDKHLQLALDGRYREAVNLIALRGIS